MSSAQIITLGGTHRPGSFSWRHVLAWKQLSILWKVPIFHHVLDTYSVPPKSTVAHSIAVAADEADDRLFEHLSVMQAPAVIFLDGVRLLRSAKRFVPQFQDRYMARDPYRHVLRVEQRHPLVNGLPEALPIYGESPAITPLPVEDGAEVLVTLDDIPVISLHQGYLLVGADPWQFGVPSVPMLYKILSNWLIHKLGYTHQIPEPCVAIRFDDLPTTAEELRLHQPTPTFDRRRAKTIARLRRFVHGNGMKFTFMYSSHYVDRKGQCRTISSIMPRSIREMQLGVRQGVFKIGSHGMVHLRNGSPEASSEFDAREFIDLDELGSVMHLESCDKEIRQLFGTKPEGFVAPAWGYRPGVTKKIASNLYSAIVDSSQHAESGDSEVFFAKPSQEGDYFNMVETFRSGCRMLTYSNPQFWKCYAAVGIPVHYMQHTDTNWHVLKDFLRNVICKHQSTEGGLRSLLLRTAEDPGGSPSTRTVCAGLLVLLICWLEPASRDFLWRALTQSSIYRFAKAMKSAGYRFVTLAELETVATRYILSDSELLEETPSTPYQRFSENP